MKKPVLLACAAALLLAACKGETAIPPRLLSPVTFGEREYRSFEDLIGHGLENAPVISPDGPVTLSLVNEARQRDVGTCAGYDAARADGWYAQATRDMTAEGFFTHSCGLLRIAEASRKSTTPFPSSFLDRTATPAIPVDLLNRIYYVGGDEQACGKTLLSECLRDLNAQIYWDNEWIKLEASGKGGKIAALKPVLLADINKDGAEDLVLLYGLVIKDASYRHYGLICLGSGNSGEITEIECEKGN